MIIKILLLGILIGLLVGILVGAFFHEVFVYDEKPESDFIEKYIITLKNK